jgi:hypothetical protein
MHDALPDATRRIRSLLLSTDTLLSSRRNIDEPRANRIQHGAYGHYLPDSWYKTTYLLPSLLCALLIATVSKVEVRLVSTSSARLDTIRELVRSFIQKQTESILLPSVLNGWQEDSILVSAVERIAVCELPAATLNVSSGLPCSLPISQISPQIHVYACSATDEDNDFITKGEEGEDILAASDTELPNRHWEGLWESLLYPDDIKSNLLNYIYTTVVFSNAGVDCK